MLMNLELRIGITIVFWLFFDYTTKDYTLKVTFIGLFYFVNHFEKEVELFLVLIPYSMSIQLSSVTLKTTSKKIIKNVGNYSKSLFVPCI